MTPEQFMKKVEYMRELQRQFFATRDPRLLRKCVAVEGEVDKEIKRVRDAEAAARFEAANPSLFK